MELKVFGQTPEEEVVKVVPSHEAGSLIVELDRDALAGILDLDEDVVGSAGLRIAVKEITLPSVDRREHSAIKNDNAYIKRQLVSQLPTPGSYALRGAVTVNLKGSPTIFRVREFQEVSPYPNNETSPAFHGTTAEDMRTDTVKPSVQR